MWPKNNDSKNFVKTKIKFLHTERFNVVDLVILADEKFVECT